MLIKEYGKGLPLMSSSDHFLCVFFILEEYKVFIFLTSKFLTCFGYPFSIKEANWIEVRQDLI